jgi:hypothetical protein
MSKLPSPITLIGWGSAGSFFCRGSAPIRVIVPHHFFRPQLKTKMKRNWKRLIVILFHLA